MKQLKITKFPELDYAGSEAFNTLSTNLSFAGETVKKIMITSCHASEGKSYLSMNLMRTLAQRVDYVLVDAAPVGVVIDAAEIAKSCDGTLIAVQYNDVRRQELLDVKQQIEQSGCPILGTVLNQVDYDSYLSRKYYYRTYGKYGYYNRYYKHKHAAEKK